MDVFVPLWLLIILISMLSAAAAYVAARWSTASRSTRRSTPPASPPPTPGSDAALAAIAADQAALYSTLEKLTTTVKRLSSRAGMQDLRERESQPAAPPPVGTDKAALYRHYGIAGKTPRQIAQHQLDLETSNNGRPN